MAHGVLARQSTVLLSIFNSYFSKIYKSYFVCCFLIFLPASSEKKMIIKHITLHEYIICTKQEHRMWLMCVKILLQSQQRRPVVSDTGQPDRELNQIRKPILCGESLTPTAQS